MLNRSVNRRLLQIAVAIGGLVPVGAGLGGVLLGSAMVLGEPVDLGLTFDSHFRYLSGLLLGIGLAFWSLIPRIERCSDIFRLLTAIVFIGGLARLGALLTQGPPDAPMLFGLGMELVVTPMVALWQYRVAKAFAVDMRV